MKKLYGNRSDLPVTVIKNGVFLLDEFGGTNCYLVVGEKKALLIDCGSGFCDLLSAVRQITSLPLIVAATHGHGDHVGGKGQFPEIYVHKDDCRTFNYIQGGKLFRKIFVAGNENVRKMGFTTRDVRKPEYKTKFIPFDENQVFDLGGKIITVKHTPGHTYGSVAFIDEADKIVFSGDNVCDALWMQLPGCRSLEEWLPSAKWLLEISKSYDVYWGHRVPKLSTEYIATVVGWGEEIIKNTAKNSIFFSIKQYPKQKDGILYRTDKVKKK